MLDQTLSSPADPHTARPLVVLFQRRLTRAIAGGARSVFDRGALFHKLGCRVVFIIMDRSPDHGKALAALRRDGILHPCNEVIFAHDLLETHSDRIAALSAPPLWPDLPQGLDIHEEHKHDRLVGRHAYADGIKRHSISYFITGAIRRQEIFDASGDMTEAWIHDATGAPLYIDTFDPSSAEVTRRRLICGGRSVFCDIDMRVPLGRGTVEPTRSIPSKMTFAALLAQRIEQRFTGTPKIAAIADGENISQNIIRAFTSKRVKGISVLHNNHTDFPFTADAPVKDAWEPFLANLDNVHKVVALTTRQKEDLTGLYPDMPLVKVNHPVLPVPIVKVKRDPDTVVFIGRLSYQKRLDHLVDVFAKVAEMRPQTRFEIYGRGDKENWLKGLVENAGLSDVVRFHGFTERPLAHFAQASLTVMTSYFEGLPLTILEAMSVGTPFVAYDLNYGPAEVIEDGKNGVLVENGNAQAAADAVVALLDDPDRLAKMSAQASLIGQKYTMDDHSEIWKKLVEEAVGDPATTPS